MPWKNIRKRTFKGGIYYILCWLSTAEVEHAFKSVFYPYESSKDEIIFHLWVVIEDSLWVNIWHCCMFFGSFVLFVLSYSEFMVVLTYIILSLSFRWLFFFYFFYNGLRSGWDLWEVAGGETVNRIFCKK